MHDKTIHERAVSDKFKIPAPTLVSSVGLSPPVVVSHLRSDGRTPIRTKMGRREDTYVLLVFIGEQPTHLRLWTNGRETPVPPVGPFGVILAHLEAEPIAEFSSAFDFIRCHFSRPTLETLCETTGFDSFQGLRRPEFGAPDLVLGHLASAMAPLIARASNEDQILLDHLVIALFGQLRNAYGGPPRDQWIRTRGGLAVWQERRAKAYIDANLQNGASLKNIALECRLSPSHFSRAFRISTGRPPHLWMLERRVYAAKLALVDEALSLTDIAARCGFADPSHFSRIFTKVTGQTPAAWRRGRLCKATLDQVHPPARDIPASRHANLAARERQL